MKLCPSEADFRPVSGRVLHVSVHLLAGIEGCWYKDPTGLFVAYHDDSGWGGCSCIFSKTYPSFLTLKEGSTSHPGPLSSGARVKTALLGARDRYALRLADHQRSSPCCAGWDRREKESLQFIVNSLQFIVYRL